MHFWRVYIIDKNDDIIAVIDPAYVQDADGNSVETHYEIYGNKLNQVIESDESTQFPVVVAVTTHPNKTTTTFLSKSITKAYYEKMGYNTKESIARGAEILVIGLIPGGASMATLMTAGDLWTLYQRSKVETLYKKNEK